jgi:hypothetical protein
MKNTDKAAENYYIDRRGCSRETARTYLRTETDIERQKRMGEGSIKQLTCERCGQKTDGGAWIGFVYVGAECLTKEDQQYLDEV